VRAGARAQVLDEAWVVQQSAAVHDDGDDLAVLHQRGAFPLWLVGQRAGPPGGVQPGVVGGVQQLEG